MMSSSPISRARPLLGTLVSVRVEGLPEPQAHRAIDEAFEHIADIERLMSFHRADSDLGRLHRAAAAESVQLDQRTVEVLACALELAERSLGVFDVTVARDQVARGLLPQPGSGRGSVGDGTWRDIEIVGPDRVRLRRPVWIDLGGIAKGYAVDCAIERLRQWTGIQCVVNAGGDIRVFGPCPERIGLKAILPNQDVLPVVALENGSVASSSGRGQAVPPHLHGRTRRPVGQNRFVAVVAERCMIADAMTKSVLAMGRSSGPLLAQYGASAFLHSGRGNWHRLGAAL